MLLSLKDIFVNDGMKTQHSCAFSMASIDIDGIYPFTSDVDTVAVIENKTGLVTINLTVEFDYNRPCDRCYTDVKQRMSYSFFHRLTDSLQDDYNDEYIEITDYKLDLQQLVVSDILLSLPSKYLCKGDCQGLCQKCGHNLNLGDCDCNKHEVDPRLEALKELLE